LPWDIFSILLELLERALVYEVPIETKSKARRLFIGPSLESVKSIPAGFFVKMAAPAKVWGQAGALFFRVVTDRNSLKILNAEFTE
jgi:hypothetical protein